MTSIKPTVTNHLNNIENILNGRCGKNRVERTFGAEILGELTPLFQGDYSTIHSIEKRYLYLEKYHLSELQKFNKMHRELRCIKKETASYMADKWCLYAHMRVIITNIKRCIEKTNQIH